MRKFVIAIMLLAGVCAYAADANQMHYVSLLEPRIVVTNMEAAATVTGTGQDISAYKGNATFVVSFSPVDHNDGQTNVVTLSHATAVGGTYATITNLAGTVGVLSHTSTTGGVQTFACDLGRLHAYVKASYACNKGETNANASVMLVAPMKSQ